MAQRFGLATHVLRHWESVGLLDPDRAVGARRRYGTDDLYRVAMILRAKEAGLGLDDIRDMLTAHSPAARQEILRKHRDELARRIAEATAALELLDCALDCTHQDVATCPRFQAQLAQRVGLSASGVVVDG